MNIENYSNLPIGIVLVKHFPFMQDDQTIIYGVNVNSKISGVVVLDSVEDDTEFFIFCYVDQLSGEQVFGICYTETSPQTWDTPADYDYRESLSKYKTLDEAEVALAEMIKSVWTYEPEH